MLIPKIENRSRAFPNVDSSPGAKISDSVIGFFCEGIALVKSIRTLLVVLFFNLIVVSTGPCSGAFFLPGAPGELRICSSACESPASCALKGGLAFSSVRTIKVAL